MATLTTPPNQTTETNNRWRSVFNEIESKVRRYCESVEGFLGGPE